MIKVTFNQLVANYRQTADPGNRGHAGYLLSLESKLDSNLSAFF